MKRTPFTVKVYKYPPEKQGTKVYFRGYIETIETYPDEGRALRKRKSCKEVRATKAEAIKDAKNLKRHIEKLLDKRQNNDNDT